VKIEAGLDEILGVPSRIKLNPPFIGPVEQDFIA